MSPLLEKVFSSLTHLSAEELVQLKDHIDNLIKEKFKNDLGKRASQRAKVKISASLVIEREREFFSMDHKIIIVGMSVSGMQFKTTANVYQDDVLGISFRSPANGEKKFIDCQAVWVEELKTSSGTEYQVGAKAIDKQAVKAYKEMLQKRAS